jgi:RNA-splicing ligase RtcB
MTGKDLIEMGYAPAKWFGTAIAYLNEHNVEEVDLRNVIKNFIPKHNVLIPHETPIHYDKFIDAENEDELSNLISVEETMDIVMKTPTVYKGAIMPDACPAGNIGHIPVGGVVITDNAIHPSMHSADICCSVMITGYGNNSPKRILDLVHNLTEFGAGARRKEQKFELSDDLFIRILANRFFSTKAAATALSQLGTQGDGNHFSFVGTSKNTGETCLVTHHGSRGLGAELYKAGMMCAEKWRKRLCPSLPAVNAWIPFDTEDGADYWEALQIVREWTKLNHEVLHFGIRDKVKYNSKLHFWNEHNFIFKKDNLFYHAKGSTPMLDMISDNDTGLRLIPLNMAQPILVVSNNEKNEFGFAPHGAGRNLSRTKFIKKELDLEDEIKGLDIRFYFDNPDLSEYPSAYKNADWLKEQIVKYNLCNIEDEIIPYGCIMAGNTNYQREKKNI